MTILRTLINFLSLLLVLNMMGCKSDTEITVSDLDILIQESAMHSMSKWELTGESDTHYFIEISRGFMKLSKVSISKNVIEIVGDNRNLPRTLKFAEIKKKIE